MLENRHGVGQCEDAKMTERCKPDYETMILRLKPRHEKTVKFRDAALDYFQGSSTSGPMAELIGELVLKCLAQEKELASLIEMQEQDK